MNRNSEKVQASAGKPEADADPAVARRLVQVRDALEWSQEGFADQMGVSRRAYQRYETGERSPKLRQLQGLAEVGVNVHWLLTGQGRMLLREEDGGAAEPAQTLGFRPTDPDLMGRIIDTIRAVHKARGWHVSDRALGERAARWYDEIVSAAADPADRLDLLAQLQLDLGKELRRADADPACSKRPA
jgi:transcriptional regulator with XRE-family HTH domain